MNLTVEEWMEREFTPRSQPSKATLWRWIREGQVPATRLGKHYYIPASFKVNAITGDALADRILESSHGTSTQRTQQRSA